jgi:hypothetical protein
MEGIEFSLDDGTTISVSEDQIELLIEALWKLAATTPGSLSCARQLEHMRRQSPPARGRIELSQRESVALRAALTAILP